MIRTYVLGVVKRNPLFLHEIEWKNNGFVFTTPNITQIPCEQISVAKEDNLSCAINISKK